MHNNDFEVERNTLSQENRDEISFMSFIIPELCGRQKIMC